MTKLKIKILANQGAPKIVFEDAFKRIEKLIPFEKFELAENHPDVLFFMTGGAERAAINLVTEGHFYLLIGSIHDNAYASATEVKAYLNSINVQSILLDEEEPKTAATLLDCLKVKQARENLKEKRLGLIGKVSDWLIASAIPSGLLESKFGIRLIQIPWSDSPHFSEFETSKAFLESFSGVKNFDLTETAKVNQLLSDIIKQKNLDAITVECFPLVKKDGVTACLPLAKFNNDGIPAGCEGDITAITGMMLCKELTGKIPWIANINKVTEALCVFSHCTIAPGLVSNYSVKTHFETGMGTAIEGDFNGEVITIFRFDNKLSNAFIATANIVGRPRSASACRTQIEVKLNERDVKCLMQAPLGNHHLIVPGDCTDVLRMSCLVLGVHVL